MASSGVWRRGAVDFGRRGGRQADGHRISSGCVPI